jgi:hypothetical protein
MTHMSFPICSSCGLSHPPIPQGTKCPMAKEKSPSGEEIKYESFFTSLKSILTSQIQTKNIKDTNKFLGNIIVSITKFAEDYKE